MPVELNEAVDAQKFQQFLLGTMQHYQAVQEEIMALDSEYDAPLQEADLSPQEEARLDRLETRAAVIEDTIQYWNEDAERGYNLLT